MVELSICGYNGLKGRCRSGCVRVPIKTGVVVKIVSPNNVPQDNILNNLRGGGGGGALFTSE